MTVTEKVAYLKGLAEGLALDENKPETKIINAMIGVLDELALSVSDLEDGLDLVSEQLDAVDEDLDELEGFVYEDLDDCCCDDCCDDEEEYYDVECPSCGEVICVDRDILEDGSINCPKCNELLEFEVDCDCDDCCDDCDD
ncbi:MAG: hypothetical protein SPJ42_07505 [Oscillospiraceae bacterium]|nr:hypothetical protein [Clostridiaceae bacterium]MDO4495942.1 hypothetical protein [Clostridiaceae bacterium]MDY5949065.1 hypothetical protein [Oscillospiraceae bacterium]